MTGKMATAATSPALAVPAMPASHLRLTARGRAVFSVLGATVISATMAAIILGGATATATSAVSAVSGFTPASSELAATGVSASGANSPGSPVFDYVQVESGQSLWQLAESVAPAADPRDVIYEIVKLNQLSTPEVHPGQQLAIPLAYSRLSRQGPALAR